MYDAADGAVEPPETSATGAQRWDYVAHPVTVNGERSDIRVPNTSPGNAAFAFDGYGAQSPTPAAERGWRADVPTPDHPASCVIDYGAPVAVHAFVHYYYVPNNRDLRWLSPAPSAFQRVRISVRATETDEWKVITMLDQLPAVCPQVLPVAAVVPARYWRLEVLALVPGAERIMSYEIETYTDGVPQLTLAPPQTPPQPAAFAARMRTHRPTTGEVTSTVPQTLQPQQGVSVSLEHQGHRGAGELHVLVDGQALALRPTGRGQWHATVAEGVIALVSQSTAMGLFVELTYTANADQPVKYHRASVQLHVPQGSVYYMPAYVWEASPHSDTKVDTKMITTGLIQTRLAAITMGQVTVCLVPGTDRGNLGFQQGAIQNDLLLGPHPTPLLLTAVAGDWWAAYRMAVQDIYAFEAQHQTVPVSEIQHGTSSYLMRGDGVAWDPTLGTVRSWPRGDPTFDNGAGGRLDAYCYYGTTYTLPTYWARFVMSGDMLARERCTSIIHWMCHSGIRIQEGPTRGAFFSLQSFGQDADLHFATLGVTQAHTQVLTSQATGSALWALLYYRTVSGVQAPDLDQAIDEAAAWLVQSQFPDGGWPYGHSLAGQVVDGAPSSGAIWSIWALWRLGTATAHQPYLDAAKRGTAWFTREFVTPHFYHGYWEDVGPKSHEGFEASIATVAFAEMGERALAVEIAKDAMQWVFTRQIEPRDVEQSAGLVSEQTGYGPAAYCVPQVALAGWTAWQLTKDPFWKPFAMISKAIGWWYNPEPGNIVWIESGSEMVPLVGEVMNEEDFIPWCTAQPSTLLLRWLVQEMNRRSSGAIQVDAELLRGTLLKQPVVTWAPPSGLRPVVPAHGQVNWLGFRSDTQLFVAFVNDGAAGQVGVTLHARDVHGAIGVRTWPTAVHRVQNGHVTTERWMGTELVDITPHELVILAWGYAR